MNIRHAARTYKMASLAACLIALALFATAHPVSAQARDKWDTEADKHFRGPYLQSVFVPYKSTTSVNDWPREGLQALVVAPNQTAYKLGPNSKTETVTLDLVVSPQGKVTSVLPTSGTPIKYLDRLYPVANAARAWNFEPFKKYGVSKERRLRVAVQLAYVTPAPLRQVTLSSADMARYVIHMDCLSRHDQMGETVGFALELHGDRNVIYTGRRGVAIKGRHKARADQSQVYSVLRSLLNLDPTTLTQWKHHTSFHDWSGCTTSLALNGKKLFETTMSGEVSAYPRDPRRTFIPEFITAIWTAAGLERWQTTNPHTARSLQAEGWNFKSADPANADMIEDVARFGSSEVLEDLVLLGAPVRDKPGPPRDPRDKYWRGDSALDRAAERGEHEMIGVLLRAKRDWSKATLSRTLLRAARFGNVETSQALLAAGADPKTKGDYGASWLMAAAESGDSALVALALARGGGPVNDTSSEFGLTPLLLAASQWNDRGRVSHQRDRAQTVTLLLKNGAAIEARQRYGGTPLLVGVHNPYVTKVLLAAGANPNARDERGETALMKCPALESARALINAGANPRLTNDGATTADRVRANCRDDIDLAAAIIRLIEARR